MEKITITRHADGAHVNGQRGEYHAQVTGSEHIGRLIWRDEDGRRHATSTQVPPEIGGRGIAAKLVEALIQDARAQGFKVVPACSYVAKAFDKNPEWAHLKA